MYILDMHNKQEKSVIKRLMEEVQNMYKICMKYTYNYTYNIQKIASEYPKYIHQKICVIFMNIFV